MTRTPSLSVRAASLAVLASCIAWAFAGVIDNDSVLIDDPAYVFENRVVQGGLTWPGVRWAFTTGHATNWHPITWLSHMLDVEMFGLDPSGHHTTSLILHVATSLLLAWTLYTLTEAWWPSWIAVLFYAVHPLRVESVAWIAERKDLLSVLFLALTLLAWRRWIERPSRGRRAAVCAIYAIGLMSKPMLVTLPVLLLFLDVWPFRRDQSSTLRARLLEKAPLFALAAASCVVTYAVQRAGGAMTSITALPFEVRAANGLIACTRYLSMTVWPAGLSVHYPHPEAADWSRAGVSFAVLASISWGAVRARARAPWLAVGWLWFLVSLVPVIGLVQVGQQSAADRYTLIPHLGLFVAIVFGLARAREAITARAALGIVAFGVSIAFAFATRARVEHWRSSRALFEQARAVVGDDAFVLMNLGNAQIQSGDLATGIRTLERSLEMDPANTQTLNNLGAGYGVRGELDRAIEIYRRSLGIDAAQAEPHYNLGLALRGRGASSEAIREFRAAVEIDPTHYRALARWAMELAASGDHAGAVDRGERALRLAREARHREAVEQLEREIAAWRRELTR